MVFPYTKARVVWCWKLLFSLISDHIMLSTIKTHAQWAAYLDRHRRLCAIATRLRALGRSVRTDNRLNKCKNNIIFARLFSPVFFFVHVLAYAYEKCARMLCTSSQLWAELANKQTALSGSNSTYIADNKMQSSHFVVRCSFYRIDCNLNVWTHKRIV